MFLYHGQNDQVLRFENAEKSFEFLRNDLYSNSKQLTYNSEKGLAHSVSPKELKLLKAWF